MPFFVVINNHMEALSNFSVVCKQKYLLAIVNQSRTEKRVYFDTMAGRGKATLPK